MLQDYIEHMRDRSLRLYGVDVGDLGLHEDFYEHGFYTGRNTDDFLLDIGEQRLFRPSLLDDEAGSEFQEMAHRGIAQRLARSDHRNYYRPWRPRFEPVWQCRWKNRRVVAGAEGSPQPPVPAPGAVRVDDAPVSRGRKGCGCSSSERRTLGAAPASQVGDPTK